MQKHRKKIEVDRARPQAVSAKRKQGNCSQFADFRPEAESQRQLEMIADGSPLVSQLASYDHNADSSSQLSQTAQLQAVADHPHRGEKRTIHDDKANAGLPGHLRSAIEDLSGYTMEDVKVHRDTRIPPQLKAHAYAQGTQIHLASGQEKHLPHEAWHVVQQKQGRVRPTMQMKGVSVNDDPALEREAEQMGNKAVGLLK